MLKDSLYCPVDLKGKLVPKIGTLDIVVSDSLSPFGSGLRKELNRHG